MRRQPADRLLEFEMLPADRLVAGAFLPLSPHWARLMARAPEWNDAW
ncbi:MAG: hypothetical protein ACKV0T_16020 [Planctomycetales bacterium]